MTPLQIRLLVYGVVLALGLGAIWYVRHVKSSWLDEHDRAEAAIAAVAQHQAVIGVLQAQRQRQEAAAHERDRRLRESARRLAKFEAAERAARESDPGYAAWAATPHPAVVGVLLSNGADAVRSDHPDAERAPDGGDADP